jgi:hypothetical protein
MRGQKKHQVAISLFFIFVFSTLAVIHAKSELNEKEGIIEVCKNGIVYVPPETKFVKCFGKIMKIKRITPYLRGDENCICPRCCGGECAIIISCEGDPASLTDASGFDLSAPPEAAKGMLCTIWLDCD